jgi:predicted Rossmann-fold nucleotide-binding protein
MNMLLFVALTFTLPSVALAQTQDATALEIKSAECASKLTIELKEENCATGGRLLQIGERPTPFDLALDAYCAELIASRHAPHGMVLIFGSARTKPGEPEYERTRRFAYLWSKANDRYPIGTGNGPGSMEAGNRGAKEAGGKSLGFGTFFSKKGVEQPNPYTTASFTFTSFSQREAELIDRGVAAVMTQGGLGTEWEIFETLAKIQTGKIRTIPVIMMGTRSEWITFSARVREMAKKGMISTKDLKLFQFARFPEEAVAMLQKSLAPTSKESEPGPQ